MEGSYKNATAMELMNYNIKRNGNNVRNCLIRFAAIIFFALWVNLIFSIQGFCQSKPIFVPGMKGSLSFQKEVFGEVGFIFYKIDSETWWINHAWGPSAGVEYNFRFNADDFIIAPKAGYEYFFYGSLLQVGLHFTDYIRKGVHDVRLSPEFGISLLVVLNISYTYQVNISGEHIDDVAPSKLSLKLNAFGMFNNHMIKSRGKKFKNRALFAPVK